MRHAQRPLWVWAVRNGALVTTFCLYMALASGGLTRDRVLLAFAVGAVLGPLFGLLGRRGARRDRANLLASVPELHGLDPQSQLAADRAAQRGPVPTDPAVRLVAAEIARYRLRQSVATRTTGVVTGLVGLVLLVAAALTGSSPWLYLGPVVLAALTAQSVLAPRLRSARVVDLDGEVSGAAVA